MSRFLGPGLLGTFPEQEMRAIWVFLWGVGRAGTGQRLEVVRWRQIGLRGKIARGKGKEAEGKTLVTGVWLCAVMAEGVGLGAQGHGKSWGLEA